MRQQWWTLAICMTLAKSLLLKGGGGIFCIYPDTRPCGLWDESSLFNPCCRLPVFACLFVYSLVPKANGFETIFAEIHISLRAG